MNTDQRTDRQVLLGRLAVAACAPYLLLKLLWILGHDIGVVDLGRTGRGTWIAANAVTFLMDAVAAAVAYRLTRPSGLRTPAWLLALPVWMASGLLTPLMITVPTGSAVAALTGAANPMASGDFLRPWVYFLVYGAFIVEGITLLGAFWVYAHRRWGALLRRRLESVPAPAPGVRAARRLLGVPAAVLFAVLGVVDVLWGLGMPTGSGAGALPTRNVVTATSGVVQGLLALAGAAGLTALLFPHRGPFRRLRTRVPLALAWLGSATVFAWGGTMWLSLAAADALTGGGSASAGGLPGLAGALELVAGLVVLCLGALTLAAESARPDPLASPLRHAPGVRGNAP
ncbi:hypothetical protein [Streptomyces albofaciens]|uniref:hypothetical protein n=1 Tax=Streptomyces albofaciens TaxID=66866 RepID=UPI001AD60573|nr:hypothetical protein [Streptomyces albofaciens]